eukprot:Rhum_TRINITY_DN13321_c1_g1::Rhum_TRINITY_DN13321_c1_g1_i1::g.59189::m.59189/K13099/CD2BP2, PPP1R59; CD2 antigen cytoplasmic tail-binding protein 2
MGNRKKLADIETPDSDSEEEHDSQASGSEQQGDKGAKDRQAGDGEGDDVGGDLSKEQTSDARTLGTKFLNDTERELGLKEVGEWDGEETVALEKGEDYDAFERDMGCRMTAFNVAEEEESGLIDSIEKTGAFNDEVVQSDAWLRQLDEAEHSTRPSGRAFAPQLGKADPPPSHTFGSKAAALKEVIARMPEEGSLNAYISRFSTKKVGAKPKKGSGAAAASTRAAKRTRLTDAPTVTDEKTEQKEETDSKDKDLDAVLHASSYLMSQGETDVYFQTRRQLNGLLRECEEERRWNLRWEGKHDEVQGPFDAEKMSAWKQAGFLKAAEVQELPSDGRPDSASDEWIQGDAACFA